jgi:Domain of unknown function (DUF4276)
MNPAFIVDGFTELNILRQLCPNQPIKRSINGKDVSLSKAAEQIAAIIRLLNNRNYPIVILTDREKRSDDFLKFANDFKNAIVGELAKKGINLDIRVGIADRMIENWILADADALGNPPQLPSETDGLMGKSWMKNIKPSYSETADGPDLFFKADARKIYTQSPSFKHFVDQLKDLDCFYLNFNK